MLTKTKPTIDFYVEENNGVRGAYVVSPKILELDGQPELYGVPFIFYVGSGQRIDSLPANLRNTDEVVKQLKRQGVPYLSPEQYVELIRGMRTGCKLPQRVQVGDNSIPIELLVKQGHVPYSFGERHDEDVLKKVRVRTQADYDRMVKWIMPKIR